MGVNSFRIFDGNLEGGDRKKETGKKKRIKGLAKRMSPIRKGTIGPGRHETGQKNVKSEVDQSLEVKGRSTQDGEGGLQQKKTSGNWGSLTSSSPRVEKRPRRTASKNKKKDALQRKGETLHDEEGSDHAAYATSRKRRRSVKRIGGVSTKKRSNRTTGYALY